MRKPTTIGRKPTVIGQVPDAADSPAPAPARARPTAMPTTPASAGVRPPAVEKPVGKKGASSMPGTIRKGLSPDRAQIVARLSSHGLDVVDDVMTAMSEVSPDVFDMQAALQYGQSVQTRYADSVDRWLAAMQADVVRNTPRHLARLHAILQELADSLEDRPFFFRQRTPAEMFGSFQGEVDQLRATLNKAYHGLLETQSCLARIEDNTRELRQQALSYMLSCELLADHVEPVVARHLTDRGIALGKTVNLLQAQMTHIGIDGHNIHALLQQIQEGVLIALPAWITAVLRDGTESMNDTQRYLLRDSLTSVLNQIH
jgi:hypothetical protein